jgi:hypothetical protein
MKKMQTVSYHLTGDPHGDEGEELQIAVPEGLDQPGPDGSAASCAAEPHLPAAREHVEKNKIAAGAPAMKTEIESRRSTGDHLGSAGRKRASKNSSAEYLTMGRRSSRCREIIPGEI